MNHSRLCANDNGTTAGPLDGHQRLEPILVRTDAERQLGHRRRLEQGAHAKGAVHAAIDRGDQAHRRQGIPTQIEERVVNPDAVFAQHLGEDAGQDLLGRRGRSAVTVGVVVLRCRQGLFVEFAVDRQGNCSQSHYRGRYQIRR